MNKRYILPFLGCLAAAFTANIFTGCSKKDDTKSEETPEVTVATPQIDSVVLSQDYPAMLQATQSAEVMARVDGIITAILFKEGQYVTAGQPLYTIESTTYRDLVSQAQAALETALAQREYALKQSEAMQKAIEADAVSRMDVIQAESNLKQSEASVKNARASLQQAQTKLGYCTVRAPFSGLITKSIYSPGVYVNGDGSPVALCSIYADKNLFVNFSINTERFIQIEDTRSGKQVDYDHVPVQFGDSITGTYYAKLIYTSPDVSQSTGTVSMRLLLDNLKGELRDGMYCTVKLPYATDPKALVIKDASISTDQLGKFVYTVNDSNKIVYTPIEVGDIYNDTLRIVTKGLTPTSRYVTTALLKVRDGMEVKPVTAKK